MNEKDLNGKTVLGIARDREEIEAILWGHSGVQDAVVMVREDHPGEKRLVVYYVGTETPEALRGYRQAKLPGHIAYQYVVFRGKVRVGHGYEDDTVTE